MDIYSVTILLFLDILFGSLLRARGMTQPTFVSTHEAIKVRDGNAISLPCKVRDLGPYEVIWIDQWHRLLTFADHMLIDSIVYGIDRPNVTDWNLLIKYVEKSHGGNYTCQVTTSPVISRTVSLHVIDGRDNDNKIGNLKPMFGVSVTTVTFIEGGTAVLPCIVRNRGQHQVVWTMFQSSTLLTIGTVPYTDDKRFTVRKSFDNDWSLQINNVKQADDGKYTCQVQSDPVSSLTVTLKVLKKVTFPPKFDVTPKSIRVTLGNTAVLPCSVQNLGEGKVFWTDEKPTVFTVGERRVIGDDRVSIERPTVREWNLHIRNVTPSDTRTYICSVTSVRALSNRVLLVTQDKIKTLKKDIAATLRCRQNPGLAVTVVKDGKVVLAEGFGKADVTKDIPVTNRTLFGVASLSKAFASSLLLKLISRRKDKSISNHSINLDTKVVDILGEDFGFSDEFRTKYTTLEDILSHRTGLPSHNAIRFDTNLTRENLGRRIKHLNATGTWRGSYMYSNLMYGVVTRIAEVLGEASWEELVQRELYDPLQMTSSNFATKLDWTSDQVAKPYRVKDGEILPVSVDFSRRWALLCGSGCVVTNALDAANWMKFHLSKGLGPSGERVMEEDDINQLYVPRTAMSSYDLKYYSKPDVPVTTAFGMYAFGWRIGYYRGYKMTAHSGSTYGYRALLTLLPTENLGIFIALTGGDSNYQYRFSLQNYIADVILDEKPWLNVSTICSYPEPWFKTPGSSKVHNFSMVASRDYDGYDVIGVYHNNPYGNLEIYYNTTQGQLMAKYGFARFLLYERKEDSLYGEGFGINEVKDCSSMILKKDENIKKIVEVEVPGFESKSPPIFVRHGYVSGAISIIGSLSLIFYLIASTIVYTVHSFGFPLQL